MERKEKTIYEIEEKKIIVIVRGIPTEYLVPTAEALIEGGIRLIELPFDAYNRDNDKKTADMMNRMKLLFGERICIGAGTVMDKKQLYLAHEAGAEYIISPNVNADVIMETRRLGMVSIPGALTPSEIQGAVDAGADFVKIFPAGSMGSKYIKAIRGPYNHVRLLAVGGIKAENLEEYLNCSVSGVGVGSCLVDPGLIMSQQFHLLAGRAGEYVKIIKNHGK